MGADEITFLDITASSDQRRILLDVVERTAENIAAPLTVGGGVRNRDDVRDLLMAGADKVSINTAAVRNPDFVADVAAAYGAQAIVVAIDAKRVSAPGEPPRLAGVHARRAHRRGARRGRVGRAHRGAGRRRDPAHQHGSRRHQGRLRHRAHARGRRRAWAFPVIASGGVGTLEHVRDGFLQAGADAALAASIFHDGIVHRGRGEGLSAGGRRARATGHRRAAHRESAGSLMRDRH